MIRARIQMHHVSAKKYFFGFRLMNTQHRLLLVNIASAKLGQELLDVVRTLQQFFCTWAIRDNRRMKFHRRQTIVGLF